ncbi:Pyridoxamine 5'-phosphate oxidase [Patulibacter medicamentivorans]|uniref:Pyridoxamine 5'-phosphate oxidase n=1 Tax=Patulibacter medicamentivorans TaxID=1097667 RepID=H0EAK0_9ACTN|nr:pyridoxamine 5'-phosphate oxidase family protein [Patulibacter medicamentivorans]EHN09327.1 Pyridoxamine 5'-phosphate oxidase [Patulibacter medicamentivorans]
MSTSLDGRPAELLTGVNFATVVTQDPDGRPHASVAWVHTDGTSVLLNSAEGRRWPRQLRDRGEALVVVRSEENPYEYVEIRARLVEDTHEGAREQIDELSHKYLGKDYPFLQPGEQRIRFGLAPTEVAHRGG